MGMKLTQYRIESAIQLELTWAAGRLDFGDIFLINFVSNAVAGRRYTSIISTFYILVTHNIVIGGGYDHLHVVSLVFASEGVVRY